MNVWAKHTFCQHFGLLRLSRRRVRDGSRSGNEILMGFQCVVGTEMMHFQIKYHKYKCCVSVSQLNDHTVVSRLTFVHVYTIVSVTTTAFSLGRCLSSSSADEHFLISCLIMSASGQTSGQKAWKPAKEISSRWSWWTRCVTRSDVSSSGNAPEYAALLLWDVRPRGFSYFVLTFCCEKWFFLCSEETRFKNRSSCSVTGGLCLPAQGQQIRQEPWGHPVKSAQ